MANCAHQIRANRRRALNMIGEQAAGSRAGGPKKAQSREPSSAKQLVASGKGSARPSLEPVMPGKSEHSKRIKKNKKSGHNE